MSKDEKHDKMLNNEKTYDRVKKNLRGHCQKPYDLIPQLNKGIIIIYNKNVNIILLYRIIFD